MLTVTIKINGTPRYTLKAVNITEKYGWGIYGKGEQVYEVESEDHNRKISCQRFVYITHPYDDLPGLVKKMVGYIE